MSLPPSAAHGAAGARAEDAPNSTALRQGDRIRTLHDITDEKSPDGNSTTTPTEKAASQKNSRPAETSSLHRGTAFRKCLPTTPLDQFGVPSTPTVLNARSRRATHERNAAGRYYGVLPQVCSRSSLHSCSWLLVNHGTLPPNTHHTSRRSGEATYVASAQPLAHCTRPHLRRPPHRLARAGTCLQLAARPCTCGRAAAQRTSQVFECYGSGTARRAGWWRPDTRSSDGGFHQLHHAQMVLP